MRCYLAFRNERRAKHGGGASEPGEIVAFLEDWRGRGGRDFGREAERDFLFVRVDDAPADAATFVGRDVDLDAIRGRLTSAAHRRQLDDGRAKATRVHARNTMSLPWALILGALRG